MYKDPRAKENMTHSGNHKEFSIWGCPEVGLHGGREHKRKLESFSIIEVI